MRSLWLLFLVPASSFSPQQHGGSTSTTRLYSDVSEGASSNLAMPGSSKSELFSQFTNLDLRDQYDAVLVGLCAKLLDEDSVAPTDLGDVTSLLTEMNQQNIPTSPRSLMAVMDTVVKTQDASCMADTVSLIRQNNFGLDSFGTLQTDITFFPSNPNTKVACPDGTRKTVAERLESTNPIPYDNRNAEITSALSVSVLAGACEFTNLLGMTDVQPFANAILTLLVVGLVVDNFYDLVKSASQFVLSQVGNEAANKISLPEKTSLPLGLGSGELSKDVVAGLSRLLTADPQRESLVEAAGFYTAYTLGLPVFAFRPNAYEASRLILESPALLSNTGVEKILVWLFSTVAIESSKYPILINSDPREAVGFLERLEENGYRDWDCDNSDLLSWSFAEAENLVRANRRVIENISVRLSSGAATIGDCVAVAEDW